DFSFATTEAFALDSEQHPLAFSVEALTAFAALEQQLDFSFATTEAFALDSEQQPLAFSVEALTAFAAVEQQPVDFSFATTEAFAFVAEQHPVAFSFDALAAFSAWAAGQALALPPQSWAAVAAGAARRRTRAAQRPVRMFFMSGYGAGSSAAKVGGMWSVR
ncbi:MAG: hypothetical protein AAFP22_05140, partial [Planctomycetota bacterium]